MVKNPDVPKGKDWFHCKKCDSTVEYDERLSEHDVNHLVDNMAYRFPCVPDDLKI